MPPRDQIATALLNTLTSPNESDSNFEEANVVDGLFAIARALHSIENTILPKEVTGTQHPVTGEYIGCFTEAVMSIASGLHRLADAVESLKEDNA